MEYRPQREPDHPDEFLKLMTILTGNAFFEKQIPVMREKREKGEEYKMCDVMQAWWDDGVKTGEERGLAKGEARGLAKGMALGKAEGAAQGLIQGVIQLYRDLKHQKDGLTEYLMERCNLSEEEAKEYIRKYW